MGPTSVRRICVFGAAAVESAAQKSMALSPGTRLGPYEILAPLGAGGMGEVYRARDPKLGRDVAIKVLPEAVAGDAERLARFEREARSLASLNHPNIVTIFSIEESGGARFLAMELVEGESLDTLLASGGLPLSRFFDIAVPLSEALSAAHERGIVHRDLKPGNVMVTREGRVKVLDFGLAKREPAESDPDLTNTPTESRAELTGEGQVFGTVAYMSPEQARGGKVDARSDVFSLGVVLYQMLTGRRPHEGASAVDIISSILRDKPPSVTDLRADVPPHLARVLRRCLEKDPRDRYQTSRDVFNELRELRADDIPGLPGACAAARRRPSRRRRAAWKRPASVAAAAILLAAALYLAIRSGFLRSSSRAPGTGIEPNVIRSIAVLPLDNYSGDPTQEYFAEGMTDELTADLATISQLRVISRGSAMQFKGSASAADPGNRQDARRRRGRGRLRASSRRQGADHGPVDRRAGGPASVGQELRAQLERRARAAGRAGVGDRARDQRSAHSGRAVAADEGAPP